MAVKKQRMTVLKPISIKNMRFEFLFLFFINQFNLQFLAPPGAFIDPTPNSITRSSKLALGKNSQIIPYFF